MKGAGAMISWVIAARLATPACGNYRATLLVVR